MAPYEDWSADDPVRWPTRDNPSYQSVVAGEARLRFGAAGSMGYTRRHTPAGLVTLDEAGVVVKIGAPSGGSGPRRCGFDLVTSDARKVEVFVLYDEPAPRLWVARLNPGSGQTQTLPAVPTDEQWVRVRAVNGDILFDTSSDRESWTNRRSVPDEGMDLTGFTLRLVSGSYDANAADNGEHYTPYGPVYIGQDAQEPPVVAAEYYVSMGGVEVPVNLVVHSSGVTPPPDPDEAGLGFAPLGFSPLGD